MASSRPLSRPLSRQLSRPLSGGITGSALLQSYGGAAAAYSLQDIRGTAGNVVRVRRSTDNAESNFTANGVKYGALRHFALNNDSDLVAFADQASASDQRMYFDGVDDYVSLGGMTSAADYFGACTIQASAVVVANVGADVLWTLGGSSYQLYLSGGNFFIAGTDTGVAAPLFEPFTIAVDYDASGNATALRLDGVEEWTGSVAGNTPNTTFYVGANQSGNFFNGIIYDFSLSGSSVKNFAFNGYGNTSADWEDTVGSNDGTVNGSPALFSGQGFNAYVTTLYDQSGNGRNATQATAASQPQIVASGVVVTDSNGNPSVLFDGTNDYLINSNTNTITSQSVFVAGQMDFGTGNAGRLFSQSDTQTDFGPANLYIPLLRNSTATSVSAYDGAYIGAKAVSDNTMFLWSVFHSGSLISTFLDGSAGITSAQTLNFALTRQVIGAGCDAANAISFYWKGKASEFVCYDNTNLISNRAAIEANIAARYGISI